MSSVEKAGLRSSTSTTHQGQQKQPNIFDIPGNPPRSNTSLPIMVSGLAPKGLEKSDTQHPGESQPQMQVIGENFRPAPSLVGNPHSATTQPVCSPSQYSPEAKAPKSEFRTMIRSEKV